MARIRSIKPSFFKNEQLADLPMQVRLLFIGLWTLADKEGKLEDRPKRIKVELFPYDTLNIDELLSRLQSAGFIIRYEVGELKVIKIVNFSKHQRITGTEADSVSEFAEPAQGNILDIQGNTLETTWMTGREGKGYKERKGKVPAGAGDDFDFIKKIFSEEFITAWQKWKEYKLKEFKFKYKSAESEHAAFEELVNLSEKNETDATAIINKSIANGWKGFFELKKQKETANNAPAQKFSLPDKVLSKTERDINFHYGLFMAGKLNVVNLSSEDFEFMTTKGLKLNEGQNISVQKSVREYMTAEKIPNDVKTVQSLAKRFAVIEHFKILKQKGNATVFGLD